MKHDGQFYTIVGHTGSVVARQLQQGNKIRIGVNGRAPPADYRIKEHEKCGHRFTDRTRHVLFFTSLRFCFRNLKESQSEVKSEGDTPLLPLSFEEAMARDTSAVIFPTPKKLDVKIVSSAVLLSIQLMSMYSLVRFFCNRNAKSQSR